MKKTWLTAEDTFGKVRPGICVPIVETEQEKIWQEAERIRSLSVDLAEWRADFYERADSPEDVIMTLQGIKERLGEKRLLFTCRTAAEGGQYMADQKAYLRLCQAAAASGCADMVDLEVFRLGEHASSAIRLLQLHGCRVIASSHDFESMPSVEDMRNRLLSMEELGADAAKLAVMPCEEQEVLNLMQATLQADREMRIPVITMSMGELGAVSRMSGRLTGSAVTFASAGTASAPGQIPVEKMSELLEIL